MAPFLTLYATKTEKLLKSLISIIKKHWFIIIAYLGLILSILQKFLNQEQLAKTAAPGIDSPSHLPPSWNIALNKIQVSSSGKVPGFLHCDQATITSCSSGYESKFQEHRGDYGDIAVLQLFDVLGYMLPKQHYLTVPK